MPHRRLLQGCIADGTGRQGERRARGERRPCAISSSYRSGCADSMFGVGCVVEEIEALEESIRFFFAESPSELRDLIYHYPVWLADCLDQACADQISQVLRCQLVCFRQVRFRLGLAGHDRSLLQAADRSGVVASIRGRLRSVTSPVAQT